MKKVVVVTGAAGGIGAGLAREAARRGMDVVLADRDASAVHAVAESIGDAATAVAVDVASLESCVCLAEAAYAAHGQVDLLFNNAGVLSTGLCWEISPERWSQSLDVNITGILNGLRAFVPRMISADRPARIVNTASVGGFLPSPLMAPYSVTKFAAVALTECLAGELKMVKAPIEVSLLAPGPVKTGIFREPPPAQAQQLHHAMVELLDQHGLTGDEFAGRVFDAIERGEYWIIPQPEAFDPGFIARCETIAERRAPTFFGVE